MIRLVCPPNGLEDQSLPLGKVSGDLASGVVDLNVHPELTGSKRLYGVKGVKGGQNNFFALSMSTTQRFTRISHE